MQLSLRHAARAGSPGGTPTAAAVSSPSGKVVTLPGGTWKVIPGCTTAPPLTSSGQAVAPKPGPHKVPAPLEVQHTIRARLLTGENMTMKTLLDGLAYTKMDDLVRAVLIRDLKAAKCIGPLNAKLRSERSARGRGLGRVSATATAC